MIRAEVRVIHRTAPSQRWTGEPGPHGMPMTYQMTKKIVHATSTMTVYGSIIDTTVPMPAFFRYRWQTSMMNGR